MNLFAKTTSGEGRERSVLYRHSPLFRHRTHPVCSVDLCKWFCEGSASFEVVREAEMRLKLETCLSARLAARKAGDERARGAGNLVGAVAAHSLALAAGSLLPCSTLTFIPSVWRSRGAENVVKMTSCLAFQRRLSQGRWR